MKFNRFFIGIAAGLGIGFGTGVHEFLLHGMIDSEAGRVMFFSFVSGLWAGILTGFAE